jgi:hypothetical protein
MSKSKMLLIVSVLVLFALTGALAGGSGSFEVPRLGVSYDGYSDGVGLIATGSFISGTECGSSTNSVWGTKHYGWGMAQFESDPGGSNADLHTVLAFDGRWAHFTPDGLLNQGTWSPGCPSNSPDLPSSTEAAVKIDAADSAPVMMVDIGFDGYCDGLSVTVSGNSRDVAYFAEGSSCGCLSGGVFGSRYAQRTVVQAEAGTAYSGYVLAVDDNGGWRIFSQAGLISSGTWSWGCPAPTAGVQLPSVWESALNHK